MRVQRQTEGMSCSFSIKLPASMALPGGAAAAADAGDTSEDEVDALPDLPEMEEPEPGPAGAD